MPFRPRLLNFPSLVLVFAVLAAAAAMLTFQYSLALGLEDLQATGRYRLNLYATNLEREIEKYTYFPTTLGLKRDVLDVLAAPGSGAVKAGMNAGVKAAAKIDANTAARIQEVNQYLEKLNERAGTLSIYILNLEGTVVASSNWRHADSFVGEDLSFRPYFREAIAHGSGRFFGIGTTRSEPGYYLSSVLADQRGILGAAVVKIGLKQLEKSWSTVEAPALVSDENGVVIVASVPGWKFTTLKPLDAAAHLAFSQTQQYYRQPLHPLDVTELRNLGNGARLVRLPQPPSQSSPQSSRHQDSKTATMFPLGGTFVAQTQPLPGTPWNITVFSSQEQVRRYAADRALLAGVGASFLCILALMLNERRRHLNARLHAQEALQKANDELERKVAERTVDLSSANSRLQQEVAERTQAERTLRAAQDELVQAGKLAVIGQLAASVAHELNQPLAALRTLSGNARKFLARGNYETASGNLERIDGLVDRMGTVTAQLKTFARKSSGAPQVVAVRRAVDNALFLLQQRLKQGRVQMRVDLPETELYAWCDANRLEQVLVNLAGNALDAMDGMNELVLELAARRDGDRIRIQVRDHGPGMSEEVRSRLFEPFFTTKEDGRGLGLGLAISAGIVADFGGSLSGDRHPDGGAVFTLEIPAASEEKSHD